MKYCIFFLVSLVFLPSSAQNKWSLEDCIYYAKTNNVDVIKRKIQNVSLSKEVKIAKGNYYPDLNFNASQGYSLGNSFNISTGVGQRESKFNSFSLSSSLNLFSGFLNKYTLDKAQLNVEKGKIDLESLNLNLSINITNNYLTVLFNKEILAVAKEQLQISKLEEKRLSNLYENGLVGRTDYLQLQSLSASDEKEVLKAENNLKNSIIELEELIGITTIYNFDIEKIEIEDNDQMLESSVDLIIDDALRESPQLKSAEIDQQIIDRDIEIAKSSFYPKLNFNYIYSTNFFGILGENPVVFDPINNQLIDNGFLVQLDNNRTHFLSLNFNVPIFNRFKTNQNYSKLKLEAEIVKVQFENEKSELINKIKIVYNDLLTAKATMKAAEIEMLTQQEIFGINKKKYDNALLSNREFLENKSEYINAKSEFLNAKYDYMFKIKVLKYYRD